MNFLPPLRIQSIVAPLLLLVLAGCGETTVCTADLRMTLAPADTTIAPGDQFSGRLTVLGCGGTRVLQDSATWSSSDLTVAVVGVRTGVVIGAQPGSATIEVITKRYAVKGQIHVTVR